MSENYTKYTNITKSPANHTPFRGLGGFWGILGGCRGLLLGCMLAIATTVSAQVSLGFKGEEAASVGIYVKDIRSGQVIAQNDANRALLPASVMKSITAAAALTSLPADFTFKTPVYLTGTIVNGVCSGDLVIESCADPTIDSENFDDRPSFCSEITDALVSLGIQRIKGNIVVRESLSDAGCIPQWEIDDVGWSYGAGLYGFNFRDNVFYLWPATKRTQPVVPGLNVTVKQDKSVDLVRGVNSNNLTVYGPKPQDKAWRVSVAMQDPGSIFCGQLESYITSKGITVGHNGERSDRLTQLLAHRSPQLVPILTEMMVYSHNLYAEAMLRALAPGGTRKQAIERELKVLTDLGVRTDYNKILDGSGLSRADRLQPRLVADVLERMAVSDMGDVYVSLFPKVGIDGTVKSLLKDTPLKGRLALKSGSMNAVQCFAGYKLDDEGRPTHVVVIFVNAFYSDRGALRTAIEKFLLDTFNS